MSSRAHCCLRKHRRLWGLTQRELGTLLGQTPTNISRIERERRKPSTALALACEVIFGVPPRVMFPNLYGYAEENTIGRVYKLLQKLKKDGSAAAIRKRQLLELAFKRAIANK